MRRSERYYPKKNGKLINVGIRCDKCKWYDTNKRNGKSNCFMIKMILLAKYLYIFSTLYTYCVLLNDDFVQQLTIKKQNKAENRGQ